MSFESDVRGFAGKTRQGMDKIVRYAVVLAAQGVVLKSPVGNPDLWKSPVKGYVGGRFRGNWMLGIGTPDESTTDAIDPAGGATINKIAVGMQGQHAGDIFYVTNALPYGPKLEYEGHSTQAPAGFVRITFADLPAQLESYAATLK